MLYKWKLELKGYLIKHTSMYRCHRVTEKNIEFRDEYKPTWEGRGICSPTFSILTVWMIHDLLHFGIFNKILIRFNKLFFIIPGLMIIEHFLTNSFHMILSNNFQTMNTFNKEAFCSLYPKFSSNFKKLLKWIIFYLFIFKSILKSKNLLKELFRTNGLWPLFFSWLQWGSCKQKHIEWAYFFEIVLELWLFL